MRPTRLDLSIVCLALTITGLSTMPRPAFASDAADASVADKAAPKAERKQRGNASFYSKHLSGRKTASGERYEPKALTAAHRTLPLGTQVKVVNPKNDKSVVVTVNDRGPVPKNRVIDLSGAAADELGMKKSGVTRVETEVVGKTAMPRAEGAGPEGPR